MAINSFSISAINFSINSQNEITINETFSVSISSDSQDTCDVKITINDKSNKIISQIESNGWKNPFYYLKSAFPSQKTFNIKATEYAQNATLCARLRKSGASTYSEVCNHINIISQGIAEETEEQNQVTEENISRDDSPISQTGDFIPFNNSSEQKSENTINEPIILSKSINKEDIFISKEEKKIIYICVSFTIFCIVIIILLALRKL